MRQESHLMIECHRIFVQLTTESVVSLLKFGVKPKSCIPCTFMEQIKHPKYVFLFLFDYCIFSPFLCAYVVILPVLSRLLAKLFGLCHEFSIRKVPLRTSQICSGGDKQKRSLFFLFLSFRLKYWIFCSLHTILKYVCTSDHLLIFQ